MSEKLNNQEQQDQEQSTSWDSLSEVPFAGSTEKSAKNLDPVRAQYLERRNNENLNEPTLKNGYLETIDLRLIRDEERRSLEHVAEKLATGSGLDAEDIVSLAGDTFQNSEEFLNSLGLAEGQDFDVRMPTIYHFEDGRKKELPLQVSFKNKDGKITRIDFDKGLSYDKETNSMVRDRSAEISSFIGDERNIVSNSAPERNNVGFDVEFKRFSIGDTEEK